MILIFGGTTEGRTAARVCDKGGQTYYYSTKNGDQVIECEKGIVISGDMDSMQISEFCKKHNIRLIINAAHPFAEALHKNIYNASKKTAVPVIRFGRKSVTYPYKKIKWFDSFDHALNYIKSQDIKTLLALTGVKSAHGLLEYSKTHKVFLRIMDRFESNKIIDACGYPRENIIYYDTDDDKRDSKLFVKLNPDAILMKESGESGGTDTKILEASQLDIPAFIIKKPEIKKFDSTVCGEYGLRKQIEKLCPDFFDLRIGFTTGTCAAAASCGALISLLSKEKCKYVTVILPNGEPVELFVKSEILDPATAECTVIKDAGDDPDITNQLEIISRVKLNYDNNTIKITGGKGVGKVTLPGLGIEIGKSAINKVPLEMITSNVKAVLQEPGSDYGLDIEISVPKGEEIAKKTFNPRLGIMGGISILGTSGIVQPFSSDAFLESVQRQIEIVKALEIDEIIINSGAKSEGFVKKYYPDRNPLAYIHYGNLIGDTVSLAARSGIKKIISGVMIGKAVKLAAGALDTHSKKVIMDKDFLMRTAREAGCCRNTVEQIKNITVARQLWDIIPYNERAFFNLIAENCYKICKPLHPGGLLEILLINETGNVEAVCNK